MRICLPAYTFVTRKGLGSMARGPTSCVSNMAMGFTAALTSGEASRPGERPVPRPRPDRSHIRLRRPPSVPHPVTVLSPPGGWQVPPT